MNFLFSFFHKKDISWVIIRIEIKMKSSALLPSNLPSVIDRSNLSPSREAFHFYFLIQSLILLIHLLIYSRATNATQHQMYINISRIYWIYLHRGFLFILWMQNIDTILILFVLTWNVRMLLRMRTFWSFLNRHFQNQHLQT